MVPKEFNCSIFPTVKVFGSLSCAVFDKRYTVHKSAETIQGRKLFKGGNYLRKYGMFLNYYEVEWGGIIIRKACVCVGRLSWLCIDDNWCQDIRRKWGKHRRICGGSPLWKPPLLRIGQKTRLFFKPSDTFLATPFLPHWHLAVTKKGHPGGVRTYSAPHTGRFQTFQPREILGLKRKLKLAKGLHKDIFSTYIKQGKIAIIWPPAHMVLRNIKMVPK